MQSILYFLASAIHKAPSGDNTQPWKISFKNNKLIISYDIDRVLDKTFPPDNPATLLAIGAAIENLQQAMDSLPLKSQYVIPEQLKEPETPYITVELPPTNQNKSYINKELALFKRHTNRAPFKSTPLHSELIEVLNNLTQSSARVIAVNNPSDIKNIAQLVRKASEIRFQTREVHEWLGKSLRFEENDDGLDIKTLHLPPGGSYILRLIKSWKRMAFLNKFGAYKILSIIDSAPIRQAPCILAITGPSKFQDVLAAGQLMNRVWIQLNEQNIAVHPYFVVSDQLHRHRAGLIPTELKPQAASILKSTEKIFQLNKGETVHMLLRVGYPTKPPIHSKRLPLYQVCSGIDFNSEN